MMRHGEVVTQRTLTPLFTGSNPVAVAKSFTLLYLLLLLFPTSFLVIARGFEFIKENNIMLGLRNFFKHKVFKKKVKAFAWESFDEIQEGTKKGADIWGTDFPIPVSDTLSYKLLSRNEGSDKYTQFVITSIESKILFIIPFHYDEYIIEIPWRKYTNETFTAEMAVKEIEAAENWNKGKEMHYTGFNGDVTFEGCGRKLNYECSDSDYDWMIRTGN